MSHLSLQFIDSTTDLTTAIQGTFNTTLVGLSFLIASIAGYAALKIAERVCATEGQRVRYAWLILGAFSMGTGIWAMHFIGMLAFRLPFPVKYDLTLTVLSIVPALIASSAALHSLQTNTMNFLGKTWSGLLMASGIGGMHFTGMAAMIMDAEIRYDPILFRTSLVLACLLATIGLYSKFLIGKHFSFMTVGRKNFVSAVALGCSITFMHYIALDAAFYFPLAKSSIDTIAFPQEILSMVVTLVTGLILGASILMSVFDHNLQETNDKMNLLLNCVEEGIYGVDLRGHTTFMNPVGATMIGWESQELIGKFKHAIAHHSHKDGRPYPQEECPILMTIKKGTIHHIRDEVFWRKDGSSFPVEYISSPMRSTSGNISGAVVVFRDVTEQKKLESQHLQGQKMESIGQLAAGIAHEINTPTQFVNDNLRFLSDSFADIQQVLKTYDQALRTLPPDTLDPQLLQAMDTTLTQADLPYITTEIPKALKQSLDGAERIAKIVRAMKDFSHPGSTEKKRYDVNKAIESTVTIARNEWKYVADVVTRLDPTLPLVPCLPGEFNQVILNLLVNAAHAIRDVVGQNETAKGTITITSQTQGNGVEIRIADTGTGIPEQVRQKIFDPFFTTKEVGKGTGQGLAIAHDVIVKKHDGLLTFESEVGQGTTFIIQLPLESRHAKKVTP
ncbi:MAG: MHYT domain-containing protein [Nitrospirales bacterium]